MVPGAGARVFYNEDGEPVGWDYPYDGPPDPPDPYDDDGREFYDSDFDDDDE